MNVGRPVRGCTPVVQLSELPLWLEFAGGGWPFGASYKGLNI